MNSGKAHLFLDLDQTLVSSIDKSTFLKNHSLRATILRMDHHVDHHYVMVSRPFLQHFLDWTFQNFNVHVWTAASESYGRTIIEKFVLTKPERKLGLFLHRKHTEDSMSEFPQTTKALRMLWTKWKLGDIFNAWNTYIVDDVESVKNFQSNNAVWIHPFFVANPDAENDSHLKFVPKQLQDLVHETISRERFRVTNMRLLRTKQPNASMLSSSSSPFSSKKSRNAVIPYSPHTSRKFMSAWSENKRAKTGNQFSISKFIRGPYFSRKLPSHTKWERETQQQHETKRILSVKPFARSSTAASRPLSRTLHHGSRRCHYRRPNIQRRLP